MSDAATIESVDLDGVPRRFWPKVRIDDGCWEWQAAVWRNGYGHLRVRKGGVWRNEGAHRISWRLHFGDPGDLDVCHTCDNRSCVNPAHLFLGTAEENAADMIAKGRMPRGSRRAFSKLDEGAVLKIKGGLASGETQTALARQFGVSTSLVHLICHGRVWSHVEVTH